ncbi:MAG: MoaD/ThiS family protein [Candidatus Bathyarchaeia archaeon]|nr:MoaD/ThiS family protein [Candidatus Bathyarchaeota archaeon]
MKVKISLIGLSNKPYSFTLTIEDHTSLTVEEVMGLLIDMLEASLRKEMYSIMEPGNPTYAAMVNGVALPREKWNIHLVRDGDEIVIAPILVGGG